MAGLAAAFGRGAMTNHWADIANSTCVIAWGANPAENHPACIAHVGRARFPKQFFTGVDATRAANKKPAQLIVIDPRKTRTALLCDENDATKPVAERDKYVRIRPGTDIALANGLVRYIIDQMESPTSSIPAGTKTAFFAYLNQGAGASGGVFYPDGSPTTSGNTTRTVPEYSKYTDARFVVNAGGTDYTRAQLDTALATQISEIPVRASDCRASVSGNVNTVYERLKAHVAPYTEAVVADICGCSVTEIQFVANAIIANSRCSTGASTDPRDAGYRAMTLLYAMGITQHTCGSQNVKAFAVLQTLLGNMGRAGGGINALRGIHNVQGSTDMGLLYGNIPAYSGNPGTQVTAIPDTTTNAFGKYMDALWGLPLSGRPTVATAGQTPRALMDGSYYDAYNTTGAALGAQALQQRGFFNMTLKWFGGYDDAIAQTDLALRRSIVDAAYSLWPKTNGDNHIEMFRKMIAGTITGAVIWGQNPAVTEPNQGKIRDGLYNLETLVCVDMFANETAQVSRKPAGVTYLIPSASHVEKAGSATNSGRTLQWRYQAATPVGNSKDDTEMLLRFAKALNDAGAFAHIKAVWDGGYGITTGDVYQKLYADQYGGYIPGTNTYGTNVAPTSGVSGTADVVAVRKNVSDALVAAPATVYGSEWVSEMVYRQMCTPSALGGTIWIYTGAYDTVRTTNRHLGQANWPTDNRAKSRDRSDPNATLASPGWGYAWLVNRRVLYNNNSANPGTAVDEVPGDVQDFFMGPDSCGRLFVSTNTNVLNYARWYRKVHLMADKPSPVVAGNTSSPHFVGAVSYAGRFPAYVEPYESPRADLSASTNWGHNTKGGAAWDLVKVDTPIAGRGLGGDPAISAYPLVLTTARCVEHFQGGPITRNNWYNVELEPEPYIELTAADARKYGIANGDMVKVITPRTEGLAGDMLAPYGSGFRARVGSGLASNQRVGAGVVMIPWHWGERGLSTGSRANDLTVDAMDANTTIPEYKACLCRIEKM